MYRDFVYTINSVDHEIICVSDIQRKTHMAFCDESYNSPTINLVPQTTTEQLSFFMYIQRIEKRERLEDAVENLRSRFGKQAITYGCLLHNLKMPLDRRDNVKMPGVMYV